MNKKYKYGQHIHRFLPCPSYDIGNMENWLTDMAAEGFHLTKDGIFAGIASFEYAEQKNVKYRLEAAQKNTSMWSDDGGEPDPEQIELSEKYSWEYVAKLKDFYIYRSFDPSAREMNTDPEIQALALNAVKKRQRSAIISSFILLVLYPIILTKGCLLLTAISTGSWWTALVLLLVVLMIVDEIRAFIHLRRVQKALLNEGYYSLGPDWRKNATSYYSKKVVKTVLALVLICAFLRTWSASITNENKVHINDYHHDIPFATMTDFAGEGYKDYKFTMTGLNMGFNTIEAKSDWLAPVCIEFNEHAKIQRADGSYLDGGLYVEYCELRNVTLADMFVKELYRLDRMKIRFNLMDAPELEADYVIAYANDLHWPTVIIRKNNIVVKAYFFQTSQFKIPFAEWSEIICDSIGN